MGVLGGSLGLSSRAGKGGVPPYALSSGNVLPSPDGFATGAWTKGCSNATAVPAITAAYATGPDGAASANRVVLTLPGDTEWALVRATGLALSAALYSGSLWVKANGEAQVGKKINLGHFSGAAFGALYKITLTAQWQRATSPGLVNSVAAATNEFFIGKHRSTNVGAGGGGLTNAETSTDFLIFRAQLVAGGS